MAHSTLSLRIASTRGSVRWAVGPSRHFVGLYLERETKTIHGVLVRVSGRGWSTFSDVVATAKRSDPRLAHLTPELDHEIAELAALVIESLKQPLQLDLSTLRTVALLGFGRWRQDATQQWSFLACCDTAMLAARSGLSIVDNFAASDIAAGGRGGPCEAAGLWLILSDRGLVPGRVIRAVLDLSETATLMLLPPRQTKGLPTHLMSIDVAPLANFLRALTTELTHGRKTFDVRESWSVQGKRIPDLIQAWQTVRGAGDGTIGSWFPTEIDVGPLLRVVMNWRESLNQRPSDVLCSAIHWVVDRIEHVVHVQLPRSQPVGQVILAGDLRHHGFLLNQITERLPEVQTTSIDDHGFANTPWQSVAAAILGALHIDQKPANSPTLTGAESPRVLGRITPGAPSNWHRVLEDMSVTLLEKKTLRSAV